MLWMATYDSGRNVRGFTRVLEDGIGRGCNYSIVRLDLYAMDLTLFEARRFAQNIRSLHALVYFYASNCTMSSDAWSHFVDALQHSRNLRGLSMSWSYDVMCLRVATLDRLTRLQNLRLHVLDRPENSDARLAETLVTTLQHLTSLTRLKLTRVHLPSSRRLAAALPTSMRQLDFVNSTAGDAFGELFSTPSSLCILAIHAYARRVDVDVDTLTRAPLPPTLTHLRLESVVLDDADAHSLAVWLRATSAPLRSLVLRDNNFSDSALPTLEHAIRHTRAPLEHVDISQTHSVDVVDSDDDIVDDNSRRLPSFRSPNGMPLQRFTVAGARRFVDAANDAAAWRLSCDDTTRLQETLGAFACSVLRRFARPSNVELETLTLYGDVATHAEHAIQTEINVALARAACARAHERQYARDEIDRANIALSAKNVE